MTKMSGNKGEWSEIYVFLKLLSQGKVHAADKNVQKIEEVKYPILKIFREEEKGKVMDYVVHEREISVESRGVVLTTIPRIELEKEANELLDEIFRQKGSFEVKSTEKFLERMNVKKIKAPSTDKTDIKMKIHDVYTSFQSESGFSIKSELGNSPTLLNSGKTTNFIYKVHGISKTQADAINAIETKTKIKDRMKLLRDYGGTLEYVDMNHKGFRRNLVMIDSSMPQIIGNMLCYYYDEDVKECSQLVDLLGNRDPLGFGESIMYAYKMKKFLCACALGMKPASNWDGIDEANGGYIIVRADGEILAYHIYNRNHFEQYLLENTMLEKASTTRHEYLSIYEKDGEMYMQLNLQIRFK